MGKKGLFEEEEEAGGSVGLFPGEGGDSRKKEVELRVNDTFARRYEQKKQREEANSIRRQWGDGDYDGEGSEDSEEEEDEDEDAELLTPDIETSFVQTLAMIRRRDPQIYDPSTRFFDGEKEKEKEEDKEKKKRDAKPMYLKDYERKRLLEKGALAFVSDDEDEEEVKDEKKSRTYVEEQEALKKEILASIHEVGSDKKKLEEEEEDLLVPRTRVSGEEMEAERRRQQEWEQANPLPMSESSSGGDDGDKKKKMAEEKFLHEYVLNKGWVDREGKTIPSYHEIVHDVGDKEEEVEKKKKGERDGEQDVVSVSAKGNEDFEILSEDDEFLDKVDDFEREYNFRFEEEGASQLVAYPRQIDDSVRRSDDRRKEKRRQRAERKKEEKLRKQEELKRLKNLKKAEIAKKLKQIAEISGVEDVEALEGIDLEGDFDPDAYDKQMQEKFNEGYYAEEDEALMAKGEEEENGYEYGYDENDGYDDDNGDFNMDADYCDDYQGEAEQSQGVVLSKKQLKKQKKLEKQQAKAAAKAAAAGGVDGNGVLLSSMTNKKHKNGVGNKPSSVFDPQVHGTFSKYLDEYYKLDFEDMIGDMPTRFKYREVPANDFGLDTVDILAADDRELNQWASLKKATSYRSYEEEKKDLKRYSKKKDKKVQVLKSVYTDKEEEDGDERVNKKNAKMVFREEDAGEKEDEEKKKKRRRQKKRKHAKEEEEEGEGTRNEDGEKKKKSKKQKKRDKGGKEEHTWIDRKLGKDIVPKSRLDAFRSVAKKKKEKN
eukprot:Nk52_evm2s212 gene=Nk52_evmTU2s212